MYKFHLKSPVPETFTVCMLIVLSYSQMMNCTGSCCVNVDGGEMIDLSTIWVDHIELFTGTDIDNLLSVKWNSMDRSTYLAQSIVNTPFLPSTI